MPINLTPAPVILALTPDWLVVSKPGGWITVPPSKAEASGDKPVLSKWAASEFGPVWPVHRLDQETSGVVLLARSAEKHKLANTWFQSRKVKKTYYCLASGVPELPILKLNTALKGQSAVTQVEVQERFGEGFFAKVLPRTGRRHQIRKHLSQAGHPLWGDPLYGGLTEIPFGNARLSVPRVALHAFQLELPTGEVFQAPFSKDFVEWLMKLRGEGQHV